MKKFAKILAVLAAMVLALAFVGCKDDDDDDEQSYLLEGGIISKTVYNEKIKYISDPGRARSQCLFYTEEGSYEKESVDEDDLSSELDFLTDSQIQLIKENYETITFFETNDSNQYLWLYTRKQ